MVEPDVKPYEYRDRALIVLPGIGWGEWVEMWRTTEGLYQSSNFYIGDALLAGEREFGERFAQVVDPKYINAQRGAMWVCRRIEPLRRKNNLSYSLHREIAALEPEEQDRWLGLAAAGDWTVKDLREARAAAQRGNGGPPLTDNEPGSTWNPDYTFGSPGEVDGKPVLLALEGRGTPIPPPALLTYQPSLEQMLAELPPACCGTLRFSEEIAGERLYSVYLRTPTGKKIGIGKSRSLADAIRRALRASA